MVLIVVWGKLEVISRTMFADSGGLVYAKLPANYGIKAEDKK